MPILLKGRVMSVGLKDAQAETKDRAAKSSVAEVEVYVGRQRMEIVQFPPEMLSALEDILEEEWVFECASYTAWAVGNKTGISFKGGDVMDLNFKVVDLPARLKAARSGPPAPANGVRPLVTA